MIISSKFNLSNHNLSLLIQFYSFVLLMHFKPTKLVLFEWDSGRKDAQKSNWKQFFDSIQRKCIFCPHRLALTIVGPLFTISFAKCKCLKKKNKKPIVRFRNISNELKTKSIITISRVKKYKDKCIEAWNIMLLHTLEPFLKWSVVLFQICYFRSDTFYLFFPSHKWIS